MICFSATSLFIEYRGRDLRPVKGTTDAVDLRREPPIAKPNSEWPPDLYRAAFGGCRCPRKPSFVGLPMVSARGARHSKLRGLTASAAESIADRRFPTTDAGGWRGNTRPLCEAESRLRQPVTGKSADTDSSGR
jgi:hypothetical protein